MATEIRQKINQKAENHKMFSEPKAEVKEEKKSRRCVPHSTKASNPEGLLESQMRSREQMSAGITKKSKK